MYQSIRGQDDHLRFWITLKGNKTCLEPGDFTCSSSEEVDNVSPYQWPQFLGFWIGPLKVHLVVGLGLWYLMPLTTIFQLYRGSQFLLVEEPEVPGENHDLSQVTDKFYHIMLYQVHHTMSRIQTHNISGYWLHR